MALPTIDFAAIAQTAKEAIQAYGTPAEFIEGGSGPSRTVKVVAYKDVKAEAFLHDMDSAPASALLDPDDFAAPNRLPQRFDQLRFDAGGFVRTYTIDAVHPIYAQVSLPLLVAELRAN